MTAFHVYGTHLFDGEVTYSFDGALLAQAPAISTGFPNFLLLGDSSATDVTGYGSLRVDWLSITVNAGAATIPEPAGAASLLAGATLAATMLTRRKRSLATV